jgi:hypothetical protein
MKMKLQLLVNDDLEYQLNKRLKKNKKLTPTKLIYQILKEWCESMDEDAYEKSLPKALQAKPKDPSVPHPESADLDMITIGELKKYVDVWHDAYGEDAILENAQHENISYRLTKD